jgi:UDP-glucuronate decarboxylase
MNDHWLLEDVDEIVGLLGDVADDLEDKTVLLGGGQGFLGRHFQAVIGRLNETRLAKPCKLIVLDNHITSNHGPAKIEPTPHCRLLDGDVSRPPEIDEPINFVVNAAGIASPYYYRRYPLETLDAAIQGTRSLLNLAREKQARFTFFSSSEIYGDPDPIHVPTPESYRGNVSSMGARACYDESKRVGETLCHIFHDTFGVSTNVIRPFNVFGPGMQERDYRVLPNFASCLKAGRPLKIYGTGRQTRTFCYINDAINGFLRVITRGVPGEAYNIGSPRPEVSVLELVELIESVLGHEVPKQLIEYPDSYPTDEPNRRCPDIRKATYQVEYEPHVPIEAGLKRFLTWTEANFTGDG